VRSAGVGEAFEPRRERRGARGEGGRRDAGRGDAARPGGRPEREGTRGGLCVSRSLPGLKRTSPSSWPAWR